MSTTTLATLIADGWLDPELAALAWLLVEDGLPVTVVGSAAVEERTALASSITAMCPARASFVLDADREAPTIARLAGLLQGGLCLGLVLSASDLEEMLERLKAAPAALPDDAVRRLGVVLVLEAAGGRPRVTVGHYLRPTERDGQGHLQRRPPAVLAAWDEPSGAWEHFAWAITPESGDRIDRAQPDLEQRQLDRAGFLARMARDTSMDGRTWAAVVDRYLATEATRTPAPSPPAGPASDAEPSDRHQH